MSDNNLFVASPEAKAQAKQYRMYAFGLWALALILQVVAIMKLISDNTIVLMIVAIVGILAIAFFGGRFWKKSNKLDPASEKNALKFLLQNQLGAIMGVLCFLPMVISIFTSNNITGKNKAILGSAASAAMVAAGVSGAEFDSASIEKYSKEIEEQNMAASNLNINSNNVFWSKAGNKYHAFDDCQYIKGKALSNGSIKESWEQKGISELCKVCAKKAGKAGAASGVGKVLEGVGK